MSVLIGGCETHQWRGSSRGELAKRSLFENFHTKKGDKSTSNKPTCFFTFRKNLVFDDDVSRRDFLLKKSSWFFFQYSIGFKRNIDPIWVGFWEAMKKEVDALRKLRHPRLVRFIGACVQPPLLLVVTDGGLPRRAAGSGEKLGGASFLLKDLRPSKKSLENFCITLWQIAPARGQC